MFKELKHFCLPSLNIFLKFTEDKKIFVCEESKPNSTLKRGTLCDSTDGPG